MDIERILNRMSQAGTPDELLAYVSLHHQTGCRISDLLAIDYKCITAQLNISILQGKGSQPLTVQPIRYREFWKKVYELRLSPMAIYNRFFFYRLYKKYGIQYNKRKGKNSFVTHAFRKNLADDIYKIDNNKQRVQSALGHRSNRSTEHYTDNDR